MGKADRARDRKQRKALDYALQIARGVAAAHEKGIVHRDVKRDNVFVTIDFELVKLVELRRSLQVVTRR